MGTVGTAPRANRILDFVRPGLLTMSLESTWNVMKKHWDVNMFDNLSASLDWMTKKSRKARVCLQAPIKMSISYALFQIL